MNSVSDYCEMCGSENVDVRKEALPGGLKVILLGCMDCPHLAELVQEKPIKPAV